MILCVLSIEWAHPSIYIGNNGSLTQWPPCYTGLCCTVLNSRWPLSAEQLRKMHLLHCGFKLPKPNCLCSLSSLRFSLTFPPFSSISSLAIVISFSLFFHIFPYKFTYNTQQWFIQIISQYFNDICCGRVKSKVKMFSILFWNCSLVNRKKSLGISLCAVLRFLRFYPRISADRDEQFYDSEFDAWNYSVRHRRTTVVPKIKHRRCVCFLG